MPQVAYVFRPANGVDCTNNGASSRCVYVTVFGPNEPFKALPFQFSGHAAPPFRMVPSNLREAGRAMAVNLKPLDPDTGELMPGWHMFGGNFASSSSAGFGEMIAEINPALQYAGAVAIHDRLEA